MKIQPLISVIVPVYNVEKYLLRCYTSIESQSYRNLEIVLIDDGSLDASGKICDEIASKDSRVKVIHKKNEGLGLTRNCGIKSSRGDYIFFLDSDDYIERNAIEVLVEQVKKYEYDLIVGNFYYQDIVMNVAVQKGEYNEKDILEQILPRIIGNEPGNNDHLIPSSCGKLYKKKIFIDNDIYFPSERVLIWEDLALNFDYLRACSKIFITDEPVYHYCFNGDSLTHKYDPYKTEKIIKMYGYMRERLDEAGLFDKIEKRLNYNFVGHIRTCLKLEAYYDKNNGLIETIKSISKICNREDVQEILSSVDTDKYNNSQKILDFFMRKKNCLAVYLLCKAQNLKKRIE